MAECQPQAMGQGQQSICKTDAFTLSASQQQHLLKEKMGTSEQDIHELPVRSLTIQITCLSKNRYNIQRRL